jgi:outer membrane protein
MKRKVLLVGTLGVLVLPLIALAQASASFKIGVIDFARAIASSGEGKAAIAEFQKKVDGKKDDLARKNGEIEQLQKQLNDQSRTLNDDSRAALTKSIDGKTTELQRAQQDAQKEFSELQGEIYNRIGGRIFPVIQQYAKDNGLTVVIDTSQQGNQLIYADPATDITEEIVKKFDSQPSVAVPKPSASVAPKSPVVAPPPTTTAPAAGPAKK